MGLDVPVDDAPAVGVPQCLDDLGDKVECLPPVQLVPLFLYILLQGDTVDQFHHDVFQVGGAADVINGHDVWVGKHGYGLGLVVEAAAELRVLGQIFPKDLDGHQPVEPVTACLVHPGHAPGADDLQDLISIIE